MTRRQLLAALAGWTLVLQAGCRPSKPITVAAHIWPGYDLLYLAQRMGWLPAADVTLLQTGSATESMAALRQGNADAAALTLDEVLRVRGEGIPVTVVLVFDVSAGADVVLARPPISRPADLAGKRIGLEDTAVGALMLEEVLRAGGLKRSDLTLHPVAADQHLERWTAGDLDAIITYEPTATQIAHLGGQRIFDSRSTNLITDVLAVRTPLVEARTAQLEALARSHFRALRHLRIHSQDAVHRLAARMKLAPHEVTAAYHGLELPDLEANRRMLGGPTPELVATARHLSEIMTGAGLLERPAALANIVSAAALPQSEPPE